MYACSEALKKPLTFQGSASSFSHCAVRENWRRGAEMWQKWWQLLYPEIQPGSEKNFCSEQIWCFWLLQQWRLFFFFYKVPTYNSEKKLNFSRKKFYKGNRLFDLCWAFFIFFCVFFGEYFTYFSSYCFLFSNIWLQNNITSCFS